MSVETRPHLDTGAQPLRSRPLPADAAPEGRPLIPTMVLSSWKGGVGKTALAVSAAERVALAGRRVLLMTVDEQEDARARLGSGASKEPVVRVPRGDGSVSVVGMRGARAADLLYRTGPGSLGTFDLAILDTPPTQAPGLLPGVILVVPLDGADAARNAVTLLRRVPASSEIVLVRVGTADVDEWRHDANAISEAAGRALTFLPNPLPHSPAIAEAHAVGGSVWALPRRGRTHRFLDGVEIIASVAWSRIAPGRAMPPPPPSKSLPFIEGWDDEDGDAS